MINTLLTIILQLHEKLQILEKQPGNKVRVQLLGRCLFNAILQAFGQAGSQGEASLQARLCA